MDAQAQTLLEHVRGSRRVLLTGPEGPDGDSIGACLALRRVLAAAAPDVRVDVAGTPSHRYAWLPDAATMIPDAKIGASSAYDGVIVLDGDRRRLPPDVARAFDAATWTGIIDHHCSTDVRPYTVALFDPAAESTCGMVSRIARTWGVPLDQDVATLIYAGVIFDTGGFRYSNTRPSTHQLAAELLATGIDHARISLRILMERRAASIRLIGRMLSAATFHADGRVAIAVCSRALMDEVGAVEADLEGIVDLLQHTEGVDLAVVVVERGPEKVKLSLRSAGKVDVAVLARGLHANGGGHAKAAGVILFSPLDAVVERLRRELPDAVACTL
jgi:phosphoesterase RecJ-like protein